MKKANKRLLINFVYYRHVAHVAEALKFAKGFFDANKNIEISLVLNKKTTWELAKRCKWIKKVYLADTDEVLKKKGKSRFFKKIKKNWDYVLADYRALEEGYREDLVNFHELSKKIFKANIYYGDIWKRKNYPDSLKYIPDSKVTIDLPKKALNYAKRFRHKGLKMAMTLAGSWRPEEYPTIESWEKILNSIKENFPNVKIYLTGARKSIKGRTTISAYSDEEVQKLLEKDYIEDAYDIGLWNQLALIKMCDIFLAPHTGFAFLAPYVGTPWLAISRGNWHEYIFNRIPFFSILPDVSDYPRYATKDAERMNLKNGERIPEMRPEMLEKKIPEIIRGIKLLLDKDFTYEKAMKLHKKKIAESPTIKNAYYSFDDVLKS